MRREKRRCNHEKHEGERYLPVEKFHKQGRYRGRQRYSTFCGDCINRELRITYAEKGRSGGWSKDKKRAYLRARSKAMTRLTKIHPESYKMLMAQELAKEPLFDE